MAAMLIGELARRTGATARAIRHYEKLKIIKSQRLDNGYRQYLNETVEQVMAIRFLLRSGLSLRTIARILPALMNNKCRIVDLEIRAAIEKEAVKVKSHMDQLSRSHQILTSALKRGHIRRSA